MSSLSQKQNVNKIVSIQQDANFYFHKGVKAFQKRDFLKAKKAFIKAVELAPSEPLFKCQLSVLHTEMGSYHVANQLLNEVLEDYQEEYSDCYYLLANNFAHLGLFYEAKKYSKKYLDSENDGEFVEDASQLLELIELNEEEMDEDWMFQEEDELLMHQESVFYHMERENWKEALPILNEMLALYPDQVSVKHDYAYVIFQLGHKDEAIKLEETWLENEPGSLHSHCNLAQFYYLEQSEKAKNHMEILQLVYPMHDGQKLKVAVTLAKVGYYKEAYDRFLILQKRNLKEYRSYFQWFSISAYKTGHLSKALELWEEGLKKFPCLSQKKGPWEW
ncbi:tetratricopeptide repeat protein [Bacillaceae bacterium S4-13-58]